MFDGTDFAGSAEAHDEEVLSEARRILYEDSATLLWVNLLYCRDVDHARVAQTDERGTYIIPTSKSGYDTRRVAASVSENIVLPGAEALPGYHERMSDQDHISLLDHAWDVLVRQENRACTFVLEALHARAVASVAVTSTRVLSLGEHGIRGSTNPSYVGCETFWCSSSSVSNTEDRDDVSHVHFKDVFDAFLRGTPNPTSTRRPLITLAPREMIRVVCTVRERVYGCLILGGEVVCVHDLDSDSHQTSNVLSQMTHMREDLWSVLRNALPSNLSLTRLFPQAPPPPLILPPSTPSTPSSGTAHSTGVHRTLNDTRRHFSSTSSSPPQPQPLLNKSTLLTRPQISLSNNGQYPSRHAAMDVNVSKNPSSSSFVPVIPIGPSPKQNTTNTNSYQGQRSGSTRAPSVRAKELRLNGMHR